jgi:hypothetical protein
MSVSVVPALIDALIAACEAAGVENVLDGPSLSGDAAAGDYLMIGVDDPDNETDTFSGSGRQKWAHTGARVRDEAGVVTCAAYSWNGDADQKAARDAVFAMAEAVVDAAVELPSLGIANNMWVEPMADHNLTQDQGEWGAMALLVFTVEFQGRF